MGTLELPCEEWAWGELTNHYVIIERTPPINDSFLDIKEPRVTYNMTAFSKLLDNENDLERWKEDNLAFLGVVTDRKLSEEITEKFEGVLLYYLDYVKLRRLFKASNLT